MKLSLPEQSRLVSAFWKDAASVCPSHDVPMRTFFVDRVYKPQVVMVCPKGEMFRFAQKPKQIEFSRPHLKTMVLDAQEREAPACPQDFNSLDVYRTPAVFIPQGWDYSFVCPTCLSYGQWIETGRERGRRRRRREAQEGSARPSTTRPSPFPSAWRWPRTGDLALKLYAAMAQTDCTACGYDCEGYAAALASGKEKDPNLCVPGKEETAKVVKNLLKGTGLPAASG